MHLYWVVFFLNMQTEEQYTRTHSHTEAHTLLATARCKEFIHTDKVPLCVKMSAWCLALSVRPSLSSKMRENKV